MALEFEPRGFFFFSATLIALPIVEPPVLSDVLRLMVLVLLGTRLRFMDASRSAGDTFDRGTAREVLDDRA